MQTARRPRAHACAPRPGRAPPAIARAMVLGWASPSPWRRLRTVIGLYDNRCGPQDLSRTRRAPGPSAGRPREAPCTRCRPALPPWSACPPQDVEAVPVRMRPRGGGRPRLHRRTPSNKLHRRTSTPQNIAISATFTSAQGIFHYQHPVSTWPSMNWPGTATATWAPPYPHACARGPRGIGAGLWLPGDAVHPRPLRTAALPRHSGRDGSRRWWSWRQAASGFAVAERMCVTRWVCTSATTRAQAQPWP